MVGNTWVLVAHRAGARIFDYQKEKPGLRLIQDIPHEEGRLQNHDLTSDRQGRAADTRGGGHHNYQRRVDAVEHVAQQFAKRLASDLDQARTANRFEDVVLVADPHMLGLLRDSLTSATMAKVSASVDKDLGMENADEIVRHISSIL